MIWVCVVQTKVFQSCQAHNSFVCYAIETSCSLLSQYLLPNGMCVLLLPLLNNTKLEVGVFTSHLCLYRSAALPSSPIPRHPSFSLSNSSNHLILYVLHSPLELSVLSPSLPPQYLFLPCFVSSVSYLCISSAPQQTVVEIFVMRPCLELSSTRDQLLGIVTKEIVNPEFY